MPRFETREVVELLVERRGLQRVRLDDGSRAYALTELVGPVAPGDRVVVNTTAVDLELGTGGWHVVHWNLARDGWASPGAGHIMKLRYTSLQVDAGAAEEQAGPRLADLIDLVDLGGRPVVACGLHSQVACVAATVRELAPVARIVYVMTDTAALPLALSDLVAELCEHHLVDLTVTAGHAFGGDLEAVNVPSALAVAAVLGEADVIVVGPGPGVVGTGTSLGASSLEVAAVLDVAGALGGRPVAALRYSGVDDRERHRGVSRTTLTALALVHEPVCLAVPAGPLADPVLADLAPLLAAPGERRAGTDATGGEQPGGSGERVRATCFDVSVVAVPDVADLLARAGIALTTMGRTPADDPGFFTVSAAAGAVAAALAGRRPGSSVA